MSQKHKAVTKFVFTVYCIVMLWLLFGQRIGWASDLPYLAQLSAKLNLIPFRTICCYFANMGNKELLFESVKNLAGNFVLFIPLGMMPIIFKSQQGFSRYIFTVAVIIICIETIQLFTLLGACDIDDLILNLAGAATGFFLSRKRHIQK